MNILGCMGSASRLAGLYDAAEEARLRHGLAAAGLVATTEPEPAQLDWMRGAVLRRFLGPVRAQSATRRCWSRHWSSAG